MLGSTIGATLNSIEGKAGEFILNSLEKKQVDWQYIGTELALSFLPLGFEFLGGVAPLLLKQTRQLLASGSSRFGKFKYVFKKGVDPTDVLDELYFLKSLVDKEAKHISWDINLNKAESFAGKIVTHKDGSATIYLREGANWATIYEELYHYIQQSNDGWLGKVIPADVKAKYEKDVARVLLKWFDRAE